MFITAMLVLIGVGFSLGNYLGGKFADRSVSGTLKGRHHRKGGCAPDDHTNGRTRLGLRQQRDRQHDRHLRVAHEAPGLSSSVNIGAFNLGNALGAAAGGAVISAPPAAAPSALPRLNAPIFTEDESPGASCATRITPVMGAIIAGLALLLVWFSGRAQPEEAFASQS
jgi:DHA1 family inner membrane transport protein